MSRYHGWTDKNTVIVPKDLLTDAVRRSNKILLRGPKPNKYHAVKKTVDGITFHSSKEARRYTALKALEQAGVIEDLKLQVPIALHVNGALICTWICDFVYKDHNSRAVFEDTKGKKTEGYIIKKKLCEAIYGVKILET